MAADQSTPKKAKISVKYTSITVVELDHDNMEIHSYAKKAMSEQDVDKMLMDVFESEMGDHDSVLDELVDIAEFDRSDESVKDCLLNFDVRGLIEMVYKKHAYYLIERILPEITYHTVRATIVREYLNIEVPLSELEIC